jgi:hypothetical protein
MAHNTCLDNADPCHMNVTVTPVVFALVVKKAILHQLESKTYRALAAECDVKPATLHALANGHFDHVSWQRTRKIAQKLHIHDPGEPELIFPCPDCGAVHTGRCHGKEIAAIVVLAPGERIAPATKPKRQARKRYLRPCLSLDPRVRMIQLAKLMDEAERDYDSLFPKRPP